jgi:tetratricopeptide (TPR) repeat protein
MIFLSRIVICCAVSLLLTLGASTAVKAQSADSNKETLIQLFQQNSKTDHKKAYEAAKEFLRKYPEDTSDTVQYMKRWMSAYEKVELNGQTATSAEAPLTNKSEGFSPSAETETPEIAEARIAITKYKDYQSAAKALESSADETKKKPLWLSYMAIAQEGVGNLKEALRYLERYNEITPNRQETVEKIADLRYRLRKQESDKQVEEKRTEAANPTEMKFVVGHYHGGFVNNTISGVLTVSPSGLSFIETGKGSKSEHSFQITCNELRGVEITANLWVRLKSRRDFDLAVMSENAEKIEPKRAPSVKVAILRICKLQ